MISFTLNPLKSLQCDCSSRYSGSSNCWTALLHSFIFFHGQRREDFLGRQFDFLQKLGVLLEKLCRFPLLLLRRQLNQNAVNAGFRRRPLRNSVEPKQEPERKRKL